MFESFLQKFVGKPLSNINPSDLEFSCKSKRKNCLRISLWDMVFKDHCLFTLSLSN